MCVVKCLWTVCLFVVGAVVGIVCCCLLFVVCCLLPVVCCLLFSVRCPRVV